MKTRIFIFLVITATLARAQTDERDTHLQPTGSLFGSEGTLRDYEAALQEILIRDSLNTSHATMVTLPAFTPESMISIVTAGKKMVVRSETVTKQIWANRCLATPGDRAKPITVERTEKEIDPDAAGIIAEAFVWAIGRTKASPEPNLGRDGVYYLFVSNHIGDGPMQGVTWSPGPTTLCGKLVKLGGDMHGFVRGEVTAEILKSEAREIIGTLKPKT